MSHNILEDIITYYDGNTKFCNVIGDELICLAHGGFPYYAWVVNNENADYYRGIRHHVGLPSMIHLDIGYIEWYVNGKQYLDTKDYCIACCYDEVTTFEWILLHGPRLPHRLDYNLID